MILIFFTSNPLVNQYVSGNFIFSIAAIDDIYGILTFFILSYDTFR